MFRATWKSLLAKKLRLLLTALSIVLGVGFVAGTYVLTDTMNAAFDELFAETASTSDLVVRSENAFENVPAGPGGGAAAERLPLDEELVTVVGSLPGVDIAVGDVAGTASIVNPETDEVIGGLGPPTIGTNWNELAEGILQVRDGRVPAGPGEVAIDAGTASTNELAVGERVPMLFEAGREEFEIVGILGFGDADNLAGATLAVFDTETAQRVLGKEGVFDTITVKADEGVDLSTLRSAVQVGCPRASRRSPHRTWPTRTPRICRRGSGSSGRRFWSSRRSRFSSGRSSSSTRSRSSSPSAPASSPCYGPSAPAARR